MSAWPAVEAECSDHLIGVVILQLIRTDMTFLKLDPNLATVAQGVILIGVVMLGSLASAAQEPGMSEAVGTADARNAWLTAAAWRALFRDRPVIPLLVLLGLLVILFELGPSTVSPVWAGGVFRAAVPLAILAGCQTLAMLTGGIDLSVGAIASLRGSSSRHWYRAWGSRSQSSSCSLRRGLSGS